MSDIKFTQRVVAFIDILGFSNLVYNSEVDSSKMSELGSLIHSLKDIESYYREEEGLDIKILYISDCLIISIPLVNGNLAPPNDKKPTGLLTMSVMANEIIYACLNEGYLVSGGISVGSTYHSERNIVGPAYQEALNIEANNILPSVEFSEGAKDIINGSYIIPHSAFLQVENKIISNPTFRPASLRIRNRLGNINIPQTEQEIREVIDGNILELVESKHIAKWEWFKFLSQDGVMTQHQKIKLKEYRIETLKAKADTAKSIYEKAKCQLNEH